MSARDSEKRRPRPRRSRRRRGAFRRIRLRLMTLRPFPWRGRHRRGAGALLGVLLLAALAGAALAAHYETRAAERALALDRAAGRVFAGWVMAAHRAAQMHADTFAAALEVQTGVLLTAARLRQLAAAPPGLPERAGRDAALTVGIVPDGTARRTPMAFGVLEPAAPARPSALRAGALEAGLAGLAPGGGSPMEAHRPAIEAALGRALAADALYVTADRGLRYRERALYRRAQPGRPWLNRMETALAMAPPGATDPDDPARRHLTGAGAVGAEEAEVGTDVSVGGTAEFGGRADAAAAETETVEAGVLVAPALGVSGELVVGAAVTGPLDAASVAASGRLEAGSLSTAGALDAASLSAAAAVDIEGEAAADEAAGEALGATGTMSADGASAGGVYGPDATVSGLLTVGSCAGCEGE